MQTSKPVAGPAKLSDGADETRLARWRKVGDMEALATVWSEQIEANDADRWPPLLQATAFGLARLRAGQANASLSDSFAEFASADGLAKFRRIDPRLVLPITELLWDSRDAAAVLRLADTFGRPPHDAAYRFLRAAAEDVAAKQPAMLRLAGSCAALVDGKSAAIDAGLPVAPGSHTVGCSGASNRLVRVGPGKQLELSLP